MEHTTISEASVAVQARDGKSVFAPWIPEVLDKIAELANLPEPPTKWAIQEARRVIASAGASEPFPQITISSVGNSRGIHIRRESLTYCVSPDGRRNLTCHDGSW
jgi:hypothetical protein